MTIISLDKTTVKKLTTAQVITSVLTAVKELVENALDAGANNIDVTLEEQGLSFIEVKDNAKGISETDSPFLGLPAYTSKLSSFSGLESLETYGFRGEALNALCQVADVKVITRTEKDDAARCYSMNHDGSILKCELCARSIGTTVQVFSLMKNIPVRRKGMCSKKCANQNVEAIETLLQDYSICYPNIRINYKVDNTNRFMKLPTSTVKESLINIFNKKLISSYEFLRKNNDEINIELIIPKLNLTDLSFVCQKVYSRIYINNRPVLYKEYEKLIMKLLSTHFGEIMPSKHKKPIFFLIIKVPPSDVDVNLEPNKTKVLLKNSSMIFRTIRELLVDYYKLYNSGKVDSTPGRVDESLIEFMDDDSDTDKEENATRPLRKKQKVENTKAKTGERTKDKPEIANKENENRTSNIFDPIQAEEETISQLPKVDLGPDFSTQDVDDIPVLDPDKVQNVMEKLEQAMAEQQSPNILQDINEPAIEITESQWSKGHCDFLKGGTDVEVLGPSSARQKKKKEINNSHTDPNTRGFLKFSERTGQLLREKNPEADFITIAKAISSKWMELPKEEREHYRELGRQDILNDSKLNVSSGKKRLPKVTPQVMENNKKRMRLLIEKMEVLDANKNNYDKEKVKANANTKVRNTRHWGIDKKQVIENHQTKNNDNDKNNFIIGPLNDNNIWIVSTNAQIWALNSNRLFDVLNLDKEEKEKAKGKREHVQTLFYRGLNEVDDMDFMHPIYSI